MDNVQFMDYRLTNASVRPETYLKLMSDCFEMGFSRAWFNWFNYDSPWGRGRIYSAWKDDCMVASTTFLPLRLIVGKEECPGSIYVNAMTHPAHQKLGLNVALLNYAKAESLTLGEAYSITFPNPSRNAMKGMIKAGWTVHEDLTYWELSRPPRRQKTLVRRVACFGAAARPLLSAFRGRLRVGVSRSVEYLNWRTVARPDKEYELYQFERRGEARGLLILKHYHASGPPKTHIVELIALEDDVLEMLLRTANSAAEAQGSACLNLWVSDRSLYRENLSDFGFAPSLEKNLLLTLAHHAGLTLDTSAKDHFSLTDNDVY